MFDVKTIDVFSVYLDLNINIPNQNIILMSYVFSGIDVAIQRSFWNPRDQSRLWNSSPRSLYCGCVLVGRKVVLKSRISNLNWIEHSRYEDDCVDQSRLSPKRIKWTLNSATVVTGKVIATLRILRAPQRAVNGDGMFPNNYMYQMLSPSAIPVRGEPRSESAVRIVWRQSAT